MRRFIPLFLTLGISVIFSTIGFSSNYTIEEALIKATEEDKHVFVKFSASWCLPCQLLNDKLQSQPEIIKNINDIYINIELDYDEPKDVEWFLKYDVKCLPTMLIIDNMGHEIDRFDGNTNIPDLLFFLNSNSKHKSDELVLNELTTVNRSRSNNLREAERPERILISKLDFSIQFGAFSSYDNAHKLSSNLLALENINTIIIEETYSGKILFKVRQVFFPVQTNGSTLVKDYKNKGIDCMLKKA